FSVVVSGIALFTIGATLSLFTGRSAWHSGSRMLLLGALAGAVTYGIGRLFGVALGRSRRSPRRGRAAAGGGGRGHTWCEPALWVFWGGPRGLDAAPAAGDTVSVVAADGAWLAYAA